MTLTPMGRVNQPTPGTPIPLSTNPIQLVSKIFFQVIPGLTGKGYIGSPGMNKTTLAGVTRVLWPNASGGICDQFLLETDDGHDDFQLSQYAVDMDVAGEGLLVTYWTE